MFLGTEIGPRLKRPGDELLGEGTQKTRKLTSDSSPNKIAHTGLSPQFRNVSLVAPSPNSGARKKLFIERTLVDVIEEIKRALLISMDEESDILTRVICTPKKADEYSASGSYIVYNREKNPLAVIKPVMQEIGCVYNPTSSIAQRDGITPGMSGIREVIAKLVERKLGVDCGIPDVDCSILQHPFFGDTQEFILAFQKLKEKKIAVELEECLGLLYQSKTSEEFEATFIAKFLAPHQKDLLKHIPQDTVDEIIAIYIEKGPWAVHLRDFLQELEKAYNDPNWLSKVKAPLYKMVGVLDKLPVLRNALSEMFMLFQKKNALDPSFAAILEFKENDSSLLSLKPSEYQFIAKEEFYKFIIDVILFNTDRHLANILVKKEIIAGNPSYRLILIDHGSTLPDPLLHDGCKGIQQAEYEFLSFSQTLFPIEGEVKEAILHLDPARFVAEIKEEVRQYQITYPDYKEHCTVSDDAFLLMEFNLHLLKKGVVDGRTLREIASFQLHHNVGYRTTVYGGEMVECFQAVVEYDGEKAVLHLGKLDQELDRIFKQDRNYKKNR